MSNGADAGPSLSMGAVQVDASARLAALALPEGWQRRRFLCDGRPLTVLQADPGAAVLCVPLDGAGWREVRLGLPVFPRRRDMAMQVRLTTQPRWRRARPMRFLDDTAFAVQEHALGVFDLKPGVGLLVRTEPAETAALAWASTAPSSPRSEPRHRRNVGLVLDGNMAMSLFRIEEPDDLFTVLEPCVESDVSHVFWGTGVGTYSPLYFSEVLGWHGREQKEFMADHRGRTAGVMRMFAERGVDPLRHALDFARAHGLQLWANDRISKNHEHDFRDDYPGGRFLLANRDKRVLLSDGAPHPQVTMSFAFPQIREMKVRCLVEQARYGVDGLYLDFARKYPVVGWDAPVVESFRARYGLDPTEAAADAELRIRWIEHQCGFVTQFLRELRVALEPVERDLGRHMPVMVQVPGGWRFTDGIPDCKFEGMDVETWAREGLIDVCAPCEWTALMHAGQSLDRFHPLVAGTGCRLWGALGPQFREGHRSRQERAAYGDESADLDPWRLMRHAAEMYNQDADGVYVWEAHDIPSVLARWDILRNLGDREGLSRMFGPPIGPYDGRHAMAQIRLHVQEAP